MFSISRAFTKPLAEPPVVGTLRSSRLQDSSVLRQHYSSCIYKGTLYLPGSDSDKTLENLGFVINLEKSNLVPSQVVIFLGLLWTQRKCHFHFQIQKFNQSF